MEDARMTALGNIQIRKISNGYLVSAQVAPETLGYPILGGHERFYASTAELAADAEALLLDTISNGEEAIADYQRRAEQEQAQYAQLSKADLIKGNF
jgi:hypothetical protein